MGRQENVKSQLLQHWGIQVNLEMTYRSISLVASSILFALASLLLFRTQSKDWVTFLVFFFVALAGIIILAILYKVQRDRGDDVDYLRSRLFWAECCTDQNYVNDHKVMLGFQKWRAARNDSAARSEIISRMNREIPDCLQEHLASLSRPDKTRKVTNWLQRAFFVVWLIILFAGGVYFCRWLGAAGSS